MARPRRTSTSRSTDDYRHDAARGWVQGCLQLEQMCRWAFDHCGGPGSVKAVLARHAA